MPKIPNINELMKMAQNMSKQMEEQMNSIEVEGNAGGGMVKVVMNGHKNIVSVTISKDVVDPEDVEMLQDLITAAVNDARISMIFFIFSVCTPSCAALSSPSDIIFRSLIKNPEIITSTVIEGATIKKLFHEAEVRPPIIQNTTFAISLTLKIIIK